MSGPGGWSGARDKGYSDDADHTDHSFDSSRAGYNQPAQPWSGMTSGDPDRARGNRDRQHSVAAPSPRPSSGPRANVTVDLSPGRRLVSTARNVLVIGLDMTGSFGDWPHEMISRGKTMMDLMERYTGTTDNQILIMGIGDGPRHDRDPLQVAPEFGNDDVLADYLGALEHQGGGANGRESSQLVFQHVLRMVDTSSAANVWVVVVTDERPYLRTEPNEVERYFPNSGNEYPLDTKDAISLLRNRAEVFCMFCDGAGLGMAYDRPAFRREWEDLLGSEAVVPIEFKERLVDTTMMIVASAVGKADQFMTDFIDRQKKMGTRFTPANIQSMRRSIKVVSGKASQKGSVVAPQKTRKSILDL